MKLDQFVKEYAIHARFKNEEDKETVMNSAKDIEEVIEELLRCALRIVVVYGF